MVFGDQCFVCLVLASSKGVSKDINGVTLEFNQSKIILCPTCPNPCPSDVEQTDGQLCCQFKYQIVPVSDSKELQVSGCLDYPHWPKMGLQMCRINVFFLKELATF